MSLATAADLTRFGYSIPAADADHYLARASTVLTRRTGMLFTAGTSTVKLNLTDRPLRLPQQPVRSVASVLITAYPVSGVNPWWLQIVPTPTMWTGWSLVNGEIHGLPPVGPWSYRLYATVTYDYGFVTIPDDVVEAVCHIAQELYTNAPGLRSRTIGNYAETYDQDAQSKTIDAIVDEIRTAYLGDDQPSIPLR